MASRPCVFLDRDGTLNQPVIRERKPYPPDTHAEFKLFPDVVAGCKELAEAGFVLVVATNQPDVGRGTQSQEVAESMHATLRAHIPELSRIEVCYDPGTLPARRRKPEPGMLLDAAAALDLDLSQSWMVGDRWRDIDCGQKAGVRTVFIDFGYEEPLRQIPDFVVTSFAEAVQVILSTRDAPRAATKA